MLEILSSTGGTSELLACMPSYCLYILSADDWHTVRAKIITDLILERVGQISFKTFLLESIAFRLIPVTFLQEEETLTITGNGN